MFQKKGFKFRLTAILFFLTLLVCTWAVLGYLLWGNISSFKILQPIEQSLGPRTRIIANSLPLSEASYWSVKSPVNHIKVVAQNLVVFKSGLTFTVLDAVSGGFIFQGIAQSRSLDADQERVYVGFIDDVLAYDLRTAQIVWQYKQQPSKGRGSMYVFVEGDKLRVYDKVSGLVFISAIFTLEPQTGKLLSKNEASEKMLPPDYDLIYRTTANTNIKYTIEPDGRIVATDIQTGQEIGYLEMSHPSSYDKIATSDEFLAVYNDNNRELIIFKQED